jgi:hypothetical protein
LCFFKRGESLQEKKISSLDKGNPCIHQGNPLFDKGIPCTGKGNPLFDKGIPCFDQGNPFNHKGIPFIYQRIPLKTREIPAPARKFLEKKRNPFNRREIPA